MMNNDVNDINKELPLISDEEQNENKNILKKFDFIFEKYKKLFSWVFSIAVMIIVTILCHKIFVIDKAVFVLDDTDSFSQFMQFFPFLQTAFIKGQPFWSFSYGLGGNIFGEFSYYYSTSPWFYLMLLPRILSGHNWDFHQALFAKMILSMLKQFSCMFFMYCLLKYEGRKTLNSLIAGVAYGASLIFTRYSVAFDIFTEAYAWVPLTIWGFSVYRKTKKPYLLVTGAALTIANSFYFGFMSFNLYFAYLAVFILEFKGKNLKERFLSLYKSFYKYFLYAFLAICFASIFLLPALYALFNSDRFSHILNIKLFFDSSFYKQLPERLFNNRDVLAFPIITLMVWFLPFFKVSKETRRKTIFAALFFILYLFPYAYHYFNGLTQPHDRWLYLFIFAVTYVIPNWLEEDERFKFTGFRFAIFGASFLTLMLASRSYRGLGAAGKLEKIFVILSIISIMSVAVTNYISKRYQMIILRMILLICVASNLIIYSDNYLSNVGGIRIQDSAFQKLGIENYEEMAIFRKLTPASNDFYRDVFVDLTSQNSPLNYGYYGVSTFNSLINGNLHKWMKRDFNILQKIVITSLYLNLDDRLFLETALGVKYKVVLKDAYLDSYGYKMVKTSNNYDVYENQHVVSIDMWYDSITSMETFDGENYAQRDAMLLQSAVVDKKIEGMPYLQKNEITRPVELDWESAQYKGIEYKDGYFTVKKGKDEKENASMILPIKNPYRSEAGELICTINIVSTNGRNIDLYVDGKHGNKAGEDWTWDYPINEFTFKLNGSSQALNISLNDGVYAVNKFEVNHNSYDGYEQLVNDRNRYNLENLYVNGGNVRGDISNGERGILALSIPFDKGWTAKVDGKRHEIIKVNKAFLGLVLDPGNHNIELSYVSPGFKLGAFITFAAFLVSIGIYYHKRRGKIRWFSRKI